MNETIGVKVAVLVEHHQGEEMWTAIVPLIGGCIAEGRNREEATREVQSVLAEFLAADPGLYEILVQPVEFLLTQIEVLLPSASVGQYQ